MNRDDIPFRFHNPKPPRERESFSRAVLVPAVIAIAKAGLVCALVALLISGVSHG